MSKAFWVSYADGSGKAEWKLQNDPDAKRQVVGMNQAVKAVANGVYDIYLTEKPNFPDDFNWDTGTVEDWNQYGAREGAQPVVEITHVNGTVDLYKVDDANFPIDDCGDSDTATWHFTYAYHPYDSIYIFWSEYDAFEHDRAEQFQIVMDAQGSEKIGTISLSPTSDDFFKDPEYGEKYNYPISQIGQVSVTFTPKKGFVLKEVEIANTSYINEKYKKSDDDRPTFKVADDGSYTHTFTEDELKEYYYVEEDGNIVATPNVDENGKQQYDMIFVNAQYGERMDSIPDPAPVPTPNPTPQPAPVVHKHSLQKTEEKAATATTAGNKAYWICSTCGKVYSDAEGKNETTVAAMTIAALGIPVKDVKLQDEKSTASYVVTDNDIKNPTVMYSEVQNKSQKTITIPETVTIDGITYKVTAIADNAFKNNKKVTKIIFSDNIVEIGKNAFSGCSKLKTVQIKNAKLTNKTIGKNAFKGFPKKAVIKVPKKKIKEYTKLFRKKGLSKKVKIKS